MNLRNVFSRDVSIFKDDLTKHLLYTTCIVLLSSGITFISLLTILKSQLTHSIANVKTTQVVLPKPEDDLYVERGSPYDNRTIGTESAAVIFHGPRDKKQIALTFDAEMTDGMKADLLSGRTKSSYDKRITDILDQTQTPATLFLTGLWIELYTKETEALAKDPLFEFGSHSYTDSSYFGFCYGLKQLPQTLRVEEIGATEKLLREHAHIDNQLFRFPGGCYTPEDVKLVNQANDIVVHWDVVAADGFNTNTYQIVHNVIDNVQNGSIIIMHLNGAPNAPKTADALPEIITTLRARGYEFVKVSTLLGLPQEQKS